MNAILVTAANTIYMPGFKQVQSDLDTTAAMVTLTVTSCEELASHSSFSPFPHISPPISLTSLSFFSPFPHISLTFHRRSHSHTVARRSLACGCLSVWEMCADSLALVWLCYRHHGSGNPATCLGAPRRCHRPKTADVGRPCHLPPSECGVRVGAEHQLSDHRASLPGTRWLHFPDRRSGTSWGW